MLPMKHLASFLQSATYYFAVFALAACTGLVSSASGVADINDGGLISGDPCGPPCFWKIIPGVTTEDEVTRIFQARDLLQRCENIRNERETGVRGIVCFNKVNISFRPGTNIVEGVGFEPS